MNGGTLLVYDKNSPVIMINIQKALQLIASILSYVEGKEYIVTKEKYTEGKWETDTIDEAINIVSEYTKFSIKCEGAIIHSEIFLNFQITTIINGYGDQEILKEGQPKNISLKKFREILETLICDYPYLQELYTYSFKTNKDFTVQKIINYMAPLLESYKNSKHKTTFTRNKKQTNLHSIYRKARIVKISDDE